MKKVLSLFLILMCICLLTGCSYSDLFGKNNNSSGNDNVENNSDSSYDNYEDTPVYEDLEVTKGVPKTIEGSYNDETVTAEITVNDVYWTTKLVPPSPTETYYTYYEANSDEVIQVIEMNVKNIGTKNFTHYVFEGFLSDTCTPTFTYDGGYEYTGATTLELEKNSQGKHDIGVFYTIDPLETKTIYAMTRVPAEVKEKGLTVNLCFGDNKLNILW